MRRKDKVSHLKYVELFPQANVSLILHVCDNSRSYIVREHAAQFPLSRACLRDCRELLEQGLAGHGSLLLECCALLFRPLVPRAEFVDGLRFEQPCARFEYRGLRQGRLQDKSESVYCRRDNFACARTIDRIHSN